MRTRYIWLHLVWMGFILGACGSGNEDRISSEVIHFPATASGHPLKGGPQIVFDQDTFQFQMMAVGTSVSHTFHFKNVGNAPLIISHVQPSCGCTALKDWPQNAIEAGGSGQITIDFNATGSEGDVDKTILVATNSEPKDHILHIQGKIIGTEVLPENRTSGVQMKRAR